MSDSKATRQVDALTNLPWSRFAARAVATAMILIIAHSQLSSLLLHMKEYLKNNSTVDWQLIKRAFALFSLLWIVLLAGLILLQSNFHVVSSAFFPSIDRIFKGKTRLFAVLLRPPELVVSIAVGGIIASLVLTKLSSNLLELLREPGPGFIDRLIIFVKTAGSWVCLTLFVCGIVLAIANRLVYHIISRFQSGAS